MLQSEAMMVLCLPKVGGMDCINLMLLTTALRPCLATANVAFSDRSCSLVSHSSKESTADLRVAQASFIDVNVFFRHLDC